MPNVQTKYAKKGDSPFTNNDQPQNLLAGRKKRCQEPFFAAFLGRPRDRIVLARPRRDTAPLTHASPP